MLTFISEPAGVTIILIVAIMAGVAGYGGCKMVTKPHPEGDPFAGWVSLTILFAVPILVLPLGIPFSYSGIFAIGAFGCVFINETMRDDNAREIARRALNQGGEVR